MLFILEGFTAHPYALAFMAVIAVYIYLNSETYKLRSIPAVGFSDVPLLSYIGVMQYFYDGATMVEQGYRKYKGGAFKVPQLTRWMVVLTGPELMEELRKAPDDIISFDDATNQDLQIRYTIAPEVADNMYHVALVRGQLTRNLPVVFPALKDELISSFGEFIPPTTKWKKYKAMETFLPIVARASNRTFVGLPLCRESGYLDICIEFTTYVVTVSMLMNLLPSFLWPMASYISSPSSRINGAMKYLAPIIEERRKRKKLLGDEYDDEKPNDFLTWLMENAPEGEEQSNRRLTTRILAMNFAAIHTTSMTFADTLYFLAANPEYIAPLRADVEAAVAEEGWSKAALDKMRKVDSFVRETQRIHPLGILMTSRKALKDHTFSDGTFIAKDTMISIPALSAHTDEANYENARQFDGFRFAKLNEKDPTSRRYDMVATDADHYAFGYGRHACPGRFFAAQELKILISHLVMNYDVKFENEGVRPPDTILGSQRIPNTKVEVMFRKRT